MLFKKFFIFIFVFALTLFNLNDALAVYQVAPTLSEVYSITLKGSGKTIEWSIDGYSRNGFKVVWSKNTGPTYPTRSGDKYHYYSSSEKRTDTLEAFNGTGNYYVRVCEYLGGKCGVYSNEIAVELEGNACTIEYDPVCGVDGRTYTNKCVLSSKGVSKAYLGECKKDEEIIKIEESASKLSENKLTEILAELNELRNLVKEQQNQINHLNQLLLGVAEITDSMQRSINLFLTYGVDDNTKKLGEGERAAVLYSYKSAFGKMPENQEELTDVVKIANGRWPKLSSETAEQRAKEKFLQIYKREADFNNSNDMAAIQIMAYGLRQKAQNRNLESEKKGIEIYKNIFGHNPSATSDWNTMQAITYSGATR